MINASQKARKDETDMPPELYQKIKVKPPPSKKFPTHSHQIDEKWLRLENAKNYSPILSIIEARNKSKNPKLSKDEAQKESQNNQPISSKLAFKERLVEFLVDQLNHKKQSDLENPENAANLL